MAKLVSYKRNDENKYRTFRNENRWSSGEPLTISNQFNFVNIKNVPSKTESKKLFNFQCCIYCWNFIHKICSCCCCIRQHKSCSCFGDTSSTDDIDSTRFSQSTSEFQLEELKDSTNDTSDIVDKSVSQRSTLRIGGVKHWNWNDSLRSNSDKFLETLENEYDIDRSLKRNHHRKYFKYYSNVL